MTNSDDRLLIIGGGPKAAAICAKCRVLRRLGVPAPRPIVFEQTEAGGAWTGRHGYTTGRLPLGTAPEKDVGFPYSRDRAVSAVTSTLYGMYSWNSYQMIRGEGLGDWIDRGRPHPTHEEWSRYIAWVIKESMNDLRDDNAAPGETNGIVSGRVASIEAAGGRWKVWVEGRRDSVYEGERLLITGTGAPKRPHWGQGQGALAENDLIMFGDDFWRADKLEKIGKLNPNDEIVIVGGGESAASIAAYLSEKLEGKRIKILILTRSGTIFSRGEGYYENRIYTNTNNWRNLPDEARKEIIRRTDRGVFSPGVIAKLAAARNVEHRFYEVKEVVPNSPGDGTIEIKGASPKHRGIIRCQRLIIAMGFDLLSFTSMIKDQALLGALSDEESIKKRIGFDLSVPLPDGYPTLYLPGLAAFNQGPGFPNLSCLGLLSDRILGRITAEAGAAA